MKVFLAGFAVFLVSCGAPDILRVRQFHLQDTDVATGHPFIRAEMNKRLYGAVTARDRTLRNRRRALTVAGAERDFESRGLRGAPIMRHSVLEPSRWAKRRAREDLLEKPVAPLAPEAHERWPWDGVMPALVYERGVMRSGERAS